MNTNIAPYLAVAFALLLSSNTRADAPQVFSIDALGDVPSGVPAFVIAGHEIGEPASVRHIHNSTLHNGCSSPGRPGLAVGTPRDVPEARFTIVNRDGSTRVVQSTRRIAYRIDHTRSGMINGDDHWRAGRQVEGRAGDWIAIAGTHRLTYEALVGMQASDARTRHARSLGLPTNAYTRGLPSDPEEGARLLVVGDHNTAGAVFLGETVLFWFSAPAQAERVRAPGWLTQTQLQEHTYVAGMVTLENGSRALLFNRGGRYSLAPIEG